MIRRVARYVLGRALYVALWVFERLLRRLSRPEFETDALHEWAFGDEEEGAE